MYARFVILGKNIKTVVADRSLIVANSKRLRYLFSKSLLSHCEPKAQNHKKVLDKSEPESFLIYCLAYNI